MLIAILIFSILGALSGILFVAFILLVGRETHRENKDKALKKATPSDLLRALTEKDCVIQSVRVHDDNILDIRVSGGQSPEFAKQFHQACLIYIIDEKVTGK